MADKPPEKRDSGKADALVSDELDELDLLGSGTGDRVDTNLKTTAQAFNTRIKQRIREKEVAHGEAEKEARIRHGLMFSALASIRRALIDVTRIDLGDRFSLLLIADDHQGWPRLILRLRDGSMPEAEYIQLQVIAHDRKSAGVVEMHVDTEERPERISLGSETDLKRLPAMLKRCVRIFLDAVGDIVLEAEREEEFDESESLLQNSNIQEFEKAEEGKDDSAISADLFEDEIEEDGLFDTLPSLDEIEALPSFDPEK